MNQKTLRPVVEWNGNQNTFISIRRLFELSSLPAGRTTLYYNGLPIHFNFDPHPGKPLVVFLQGAKSEGILPPYIGGKGVTSGVECSLLQISDPSLYIAEDLNLAWYAGSSIQPNLQMLLASLSEFAAESASSSQIVFAGGSGGGFASIKLASAFPTATALVWNPQTDIEKYNAEHVDHYFSRAWRGNRSHAKRTIATSLLAPSIKNSQYRILYFQSATDIWHIKDHLKPFLSYSRGSKIEIQLLQADWGEGHIPPPKELISSTLQSITAGNALPCFEGTGFVRKN